MKLSIKRIFRNKKLMQNLLLVLIILALTVLFTAFNRRYLSVNNFFNIMTQMSINLIVATGVTFVVIARGIDLSVGSVMAMSGCIAAVMMAKGMGIFPSFCAGVFSGILAGILIGVLVAKGKVPPFVATLGMMSIARGIALIITRGRVIIGLPDNFNAIGLSFIKKVFPIPVLISLVIFGICWVVLNRTKFGFSVFAAGGNPEVTRLSGINTDRVLIKVYTISAMLGAVAGIVLTARVSSGQPNLASGYELQAVAAVVIGGASLLGGEGSLSGTFLGASLMAMLSTGLNMLNVHYFYQQVIIGCIIIGAVLLDSIRSKGRLT